MTNLFAICKSIIITLLISTAVASALFFLQLKFWPVFIIATLLQMLGSHILKTLYQVYIKYKNNAQMIMQASAFDTQGVELDCAYCGNKNLIPIKFDIHNTFECIKCNKESAVYINITTAQKTNPLPTSHLNINVFDDNIEIAKNKILND
jgi:hypothetical protein